MRLHTLFMVLLSSVALTACATFRPPEISYDDDPRPALFQSDPPKPVEVVEIPKPLPLPGQLKAVSGAKPSGPETGALYQVYTAPGQVTDIALQEGEQLVGSGPVAAGDTVRWIIGDTESGTGQTKRVHIEVKPTRPDLVTNLVINTDRRTYHLELRSTEKAYMASVSWQYPQDQLIALRRYNAVAEAAAPVDTGLDLGRLNFRYAIEGDTPAWRPLRAFDDGAKVFIEFPRGIRQGEMPPLFVLGPEGGAELVNYRARQNYYVVDRLFAAAELRLGGDHQQKVRIVRTDGRPRW